MSLVLVWCLGEAAVRYKERHRTTVPGEYATLYYRAQRVGIGLVRATDYYGWVHIDSAGFRGPEVSLQKAPGVLRVMAVGASTTFDRGVTADSLTWPAQLQRILTTGPAATRVEVINAGVPGYCALDNVIRLETDLYAYHPDVIIFYPAHMDLFNFLHTSLEGGPSRFERRPDAVADVTPWEEWLENHSLLYVKLREKAEALSFSRGHASQSGTTVQAGAAARDSLISAGARQFAQDVRLFLVAARSLGIRVVVPSMVEVSGDAVDAPDSLQREEWRHSVPFAAPSTVLLGYRAYNAALREDAQEEGAVFLPMEGCGLTEPRYYEAGDPVHFNDAGSERMADCVASGLRNARVVPGAR